MTAANISVGRVSEVALARLRCWPDNPRRIVPARLDDLVRSVAADREMLWARPVLALPTGEVFCGNQRLRAGQILGWESIPTLFLDIGWERAKQWALKDNNNWADWDEPALAALLAELQADGVDLALSGFETRDLDRILAGLTKQIDPDDVPPPPASPDSQTGIVYTLGAHRLLCGDATEAKQVARLMNGEQAGLLACDPPYGVRYEGKTRAALTIQNDDPEELSPFLDAAFAAVGGFLEPGAPFYIFSPAGPAGTVFRVAVARVGWQLHQSLVWVKNSIVLGHSDYHYRHEDVLYGWTPGEGRPGRGRHKGSRWYGGNDQGTVLFADRPSRSTDHPTTKPVELLKTLIRNSSRRGDIILDPFAGSGTTLIACEQLGRRCFAIEIDPAYCDVIRRRYEEYVRDE